MFAFGVKASVDITPDFTGAPSGWATDRFAPNSFGNVGTFQGRDNVLGIGISSAQASANRPSGQQVGFYNTQGDGYQFSSLQGVGSMLSADLWISSSMADSANGAIRTDMWGVMRDGANAISDYPIIGFANTPNADGSGSSGGHFQVYDSSIGWTTISTAVNYNSWNTLSIELTGSSCIFSVNGSDVFTVNDINGSVGFSSMIMQAYNFGDTATFPNVNSADYTAHWANTAAVPEPSTVVAGAILLLPFGVSTLRILRKSRKA